MSIGELRIGWSAALLGTVIALSGCSAEERTQTTRSEAVGERTADDPAALPVTPDEVLEPRDGRVDVENYFATETPHRVFGIELGDGTAPPQVVIANVRTWSTRSYQEGELVGRGMRIARIDERTVTFHTAHGDVVLSPGDTVKLRIVRHKLDVVARPLGKNRFALDTAAARAARDVLPSFEQAELYGGPVLKLGEVAPGSLFAEADFREGDLVTELDGVPANESTLAEIRRALTDGRPSVNVRIYRGGIPLDRTYTTTR
jgi:hypothetical protein